MDATSDVDFCAVCRKETTKICSKCKAVSYCGEKCQRKDWKSHEPNCELVLDNVAWCERCYVSQDLRAVCFQCGFAFCGPCFHESKKRGRCPGCSRPTIASCVANEANVRVLKALIDNEDVSPNKRSFWYFALGKTLEPKNITQAKQYLNLAGDLGHGEGYGRLGMIYMKEGDWHRAKEVAEKGAALQCVGAMYYLGKCYYEGAFGGNADYRAGKKWLKEGASLGDAACIYSLGVMDFNGLGTAVNHEKAVTRFRRSATKGHSKSQTALGNCYHDGQGVVQSFDEARSWWEKAAAQGHEEAIDCLRKL